MATHSSTLAWKTPWTEEPGRLQSMGSLAVGRDWATSLSLFKAAVHGVASSWMWLSDFTFTFHFHALEKEMATHSSVLAWRIPGTVEPDGLPCMGSHRVRHNWCDSAAAAAASWEYRASISGVSALPSLCLFSYSAMSDSFVTPWTIACQSPQSMGFSKEEYWSGLPFPSPLPSVV